MHATAKVLCSKDSTSMEEILFFIKWKTLLVLDNASTQNTINVKKLNECETDIWMMPSGLAWKLQPFDISINKVFKVNLRNKYVKYCIEDNKFKVA